ncbi:MAG TPA: 3-dehydroquinate synthase II [Candidatus Thermoplasmatota archaeon]|jgi:3-dehydroquinate synthase II|nr:3-dehydroquinate synthase II [Candidatus Thermoplasmatota archaeon]
MREAWIQLEPGDKATLTFALERGFTTFVAPKDAGALRSLGKFSLVVLEGDQLVRDGRVLGHRVEIAQPSDQDKARARGGADEVLLIAARDWAIIPAENLIAAFQGTRTRLFAEVRTAEEARTFLTTLEVGVHGVVLRPRGKEEIQKLRDVLDSFEAEKVQLQAAEVLEVRAAGVGDRVCIDTCSLMKPGEGILTGSQSGGLFLVHSESLESGYVAARPFRVNAGPVHAYALCPGGKTKYLSELQTGDEVLVVNAEGHARRAVVGRVKIETRPLLLVKARLGSKTLTSVFQNAETIRLVTAKGPRSVAELQAGDQVLVRTEDIGRHFGMAVKETVVEK